MKLVQDKFVSRNKFFWVESFVCTK